MLSDDDDDDDDGGNTDRIIYLLLLNIISHLRKINDTINKIIYFFPKTFTYCK